MMNRHSGCGGRLHRIDLLTQYVEVEGQVRIAVVDADPKHAHWVCDLCGKTFVQAKRQPKEAKK